MKKLAIVIGHNTKSQGAIRSDTGETEYSFNTRLATVLSRLSDSYGLDLKVFTRKPHGGYSKEIKTVYKEVDDWGADGAIELHFNSAGDPSASGTETLTSGSEKSKILAEEVQMELVESLGLRDRGIKVRNARTKGRGYQSLIAGKTPTILIEPFFGTSKKDLKQVDDKAELERLAEAILEGTKTALDKF